MEIIEHQIFTWKKLKVMDLAKNDLAKKMGITSSFDVALPVTWLHGFCAETGLDYAKVVYSSFMVYTPTDYWGTVHSAWDECQWALNAQRIDSILDFLADKYATQIKEDIKRLCNSDMGKASGKLSKDIFISLDMNGELWTPRKK